MITETLTAHELHSRVNDGIHVQLLWRAHDDYLFVAVTDSKRAEEFCLEVRDRTRALDVFHHPFAYAAHYGVTAAVTRAEAPLSVTLST
jgi:hypothetical protein